MAKQLKSPGIAELYKGGIILLASFIVLPSLTYALSYDLQPYTTCIDGSCSTSLDVSTLGLSQSKINNIKAINITNFLTKSGVINNFSYSWSGNTLTITGKVNNNVYWSFGAGGDNFDPWWNYTISSWSANNTYSAGAEGASDTNACGGYYRGLQIYAKTNARIVRVMVPDGHLICSGGASISNSSGWSCNATSISGSVAEFNCNITAGRYYYVQIIPNGSWHFFNNDKFPTSSQDFNATNATQNASLFNPQLNQNLSMVIANITSQNYTSTDYSIYYTTALLLNGSAANITWDNATALNLTAYTNMTGLNVSVLKNGTLLNSSLTSCNYSASLAAGLWNITATFTNASMNDSLTYWANITYTAPLTNNQLCYNIPSDVISTLSCVDNNTLKQNWTMGNESCIAFETCLYGCDNITASCSPPDYQVSLMVMAIIAVMIYIMYALYRWF